MSTYNEKLRTATSRTTGIAAENIANTAGFTGSEIDNSVNLDPEATIEAVYSYAVAPTAAKTVRLHLLKAVDGTNYEEVSAKNVVASFSPTADTSAHRVVLCNDLLLGPHKFKLYALNVDTAQTIALTLVCYTYGRKIEPAA